MLIYKCIFTGAEVLCDEGRPVQVDGAMFTVKGRMIELGEENFGIASNVDEDAEEGATAEGTESKKKKICDVIHNNRLQESTFDKASYMAYIKGYMQNLMAKMKEGGADEATCKAFAAGAQAMVKKVVASIDDWQFFYPDMGDDCDYDASICVLCKWEDENTPVFYYFKDGLRAEKV